MTFPAVPAPGLFGLERAAGAVALQAWLKRLRPRKRRGAALVAALALAVAGCGSVEDAAKRCHDHGGIANIDGDLDGGLDTNSDAVVKCEDGTLLEYQGWNVNEVER